MLEIPLSAANTTAQAMYAPASAHRATLTLPSVMTSMRTGATTEITLLSVK